MEDLKARRGSEGGWTQQGIRPCQPSASSAIIPAWGNQQSYGGECSQLGSWNEGGQKEKQLPPSPGAVACNPGESKDFPASSCQEERGREGTCRNRSGQILDYCPKGGDSQIRTQIERWLLDRQKELGAGLPEQIKCDPGDSAP